MKRQFADNAFHVIDPSLTEVIEAQANYVAIRVAGDETPYIKRGTLQSMGQLLDALQFMRIRRNLRTNAALCVS